MVRQSGNFDIKRACHKFILHRPAQKHNLGDGRAHPMCSDACANLHIELGTFTEELCCPNLANPDADFACMGCRKFHPQPKLAAVLSNQSKTFAPLLNGAGYPPSGRIAEPTSKVQRKQDRGREQGEDRHANHSMHQESPKFWRRSSTAPTQPSGRIREAEERALVAEQNALNARQLSEDANGQIERMQRQIDRMMQMISQNASPIAVPRTPQGWPPPHRQAEDAREDAGQCDQACSASSQARGATD